MGPLKEGSVIPGISEASELRKEEEIPIEDGRRGDVDTNMANQPDKHRKNVQKHINGSRDNISASSGSLFSPDQEATLKNLSFQGVPNSALSRPATNLNSIQSTNENTPYFPADLNRHGNVTRRSTGQIPHAQFKAGEGNNSTSKLEQRPTHHKRRSIIGSIDGRINTNNWGKEFGDAFKRLSVMSKLKLQKKYQAINEQLYDNEINEQDIPTQKLASDLIDSLLAGSPGALFASTIFLRDEHGNRRAPLLLAMLEVRVQPIYGPISSDSSGGEEDDEDEEEEEGGGNDTSITNRNQSNADVTHPTNENYSSHPRNEHADNNDISSRRTSLGSFQSKSKKKYVEKNNDYTMFNLNLEYGVGSRRQKWSIIKSYKEIATLHNTLKLIFLQQLAANKLYINNGKVGNIRLPKFPKFPKNALKRNHHLERRRSSTRENVNNTSGIGLSSSASTRFSSPSLNIESALSDNTSLSDSRHSSLFAFNINDIKMKHLDDLIAEEDTPYQPMHLRLERYLRLLNLALCLRPQANRLCEFYEFSPIGNLLSYENGYQGKEGSLHISSSAKTQGWRFSHLNTNDFKEMVERHTDKWFLVRHSYITYVSDLCSTTPLDVFLVDSMFKIHLPGFNKKKYEELMEADVDWSKAKSKKLSTKLLITLENSERKITLVCKSEYNMKQWSRSIKHMLKSTIWSQPHRFKSFAPVRKNAFCKYLIDGRDYFWALSEAIPMAEDVIYIHDWWLTPELYLRRPIDGNQEYRIDRLLKERAEKGVKIFIVVYRNVGTTVGTDSLWTKHSMLNLHPNIHLIRSPNQWKQNIFFWAHHEKFVVIDHTIAVVGGIDLCYGRYDTPQHALRDDIEDLKKQNFPGKDYSNARVSDFYALNKPFESMYDRKEIPRMPWHDVQMMTVGEPARDLARHFVQRWNYLLREKRPSRLTPLLTPANDFTKEELENSPFFQVLKGKSTCEVQIVRSAGAWSLGIKEIESSIQMAYLKLIETSQHYVYIENQFFVTSSSWDGVIIENKIGDALVDRIIRANNDGKVWKAIIVIPLMPGFDHPIDEAEASF